MYGWSTAKNVSYCGLILLGTSGGQLFPNPFIPAQTDFLVPGAPLAVDDFNGDGKADLLLPGLGGVDLYPGNGDGGFASPIHSPASSVLAVADFNRDGNLDILVSVYGGARVALGRSATPHSVDKSVSTIGHLKGSNLKAKRSKTPKRR